LANGAQIWQVLEHKFGFILLVKLNGHFFAKLFAWQTSLVKTTQVVNFSNILRARFLHESVLRRFFSTFSLAS